jgi:hypothetical protein
MLVPNRLSAQSQPSSAPGSDRRDRLDQAFAGDWLREMDGKARFTASQDVFRLPVAAQRNAGKLVPVRPYLAYQVVATTVRQS